MTGSLYRTVNNKVDDLLLGCFKHELCEYICMHFAFVYKCCVQEVNYSLLIHPSLILVGGYVWCL